MNDPAVYFWNALRRSGLLDKDYLSQQESQSQSQNPAESAASLVEKGALTAWQARRLLAGQATFMLGKYRLLDRIGCGGMGIVYKAEHTVLQRTVALKVVRPELLQQSEDSPRFQREVQALAALKHSTIVGVFDADRLGGLCYLAMEFVDGVDVRQMLHHHTKLPPVTACHVARYIAQGLEHAWERGFIHRDIKPTNIIARVGDCAENTSPIKILDMGLARLVQPGQQSFQTNDGSLLGTLDYMAPEQAQGSKHLDIRADIYSLGVTLYEMLSGDLPFQGEQPMQRVVARLMGNAPRVDEHPSAPELPGDLADVVARMLTQLPEERYRDPTEVIAALTPYCADDDGELLRMAEESRRSLDLLYENDTVGQSSQSPSLRGDETVGHSTVTGGTAPLADAIDQQILVLLERLGKVTNEVADETVDMAPAPTATQTSRYNNKTTWLAGLGVLVIAALAATIWFRGHVPQGQPDGPPLAANIGDELNPLGPTTPDDSDQTRPTLPQNEQPQPVPTPPFTPTNISPLEYASTEEGPDIVLGDPNFKHQDEVDFVDFAPDGSFLASACRNEAIRLWRTKSRSPLRVIKCYDDITECHAFAIHPNGTQLLICESSPGLSVWNIENHVRESFVTMGEEHLSAIAISKDGKTIIAGSSTGRIFRWTYGTKDVLAAKTRHSGAVRSISLADDAKTFATAGEDGLLKIWNATNLDNDATTSLTSRSTAPIFVHLMLDGRVFYGGWGYELGFWDPGKAKDALQRLPEPQNDITALAIDHEDLRFVIGTAGGDLLLYSAVNLELPEVIERAHYDHVNAIAFGPDSDQFATVGADLAVRVWDTASLTEKYATTAHGASANCVAFDESGNFLVSGGKDGAAKVWDIEQEKCVRSERLDRFELRGVNFVTHQQADSLIEAATRFQYIRLSTETRENTTIGKANISGTGFTVGTRLLPGESGWLVVRDVDRLSLWDLSTKKIVAETIIPLKHLMLRSVSIRADGSQVALGLCVRQEFTGQLIVWDVANDSHAVRGEFENPVNATAWIDEKGLVLAGGSSTAYVVDPMTGEVRISFASEQVSMYHFAVAAGKPIVAAAESDGTVAFWHLNYEQRSGTRYHFAKRPQDTSVVGWAMAFNPTGDRLATANVNGTIGLYDVPPPPAQEP